MSNDYPQSGVPEGAPDQVPAVSPAVQAGPDSMRLPPNPLSGQQPTTENYEERYKGLMRRYNEDRQAWDTQRSEFQKGLDQMATRFQALETQLKPSSVQPKAQGTTEQTPAQPNSDSDLFDMMAERESELYRSKVVMEYMQPGQLGHGLPLAMFLESIPLVPPVLKDDGTVDDSGQRSAVEKVVNALRGVQSTTQQSTQQSMMRGYTPGVSPGPSSLPDTAEAKTARYLYLKEHKGTDEFIKLPLEQQNAIDAEYYKLHQEVGQYMSGQTRPWMSAEELGNSVNQLLARIGVLEGLVRK